MRSWISGAALIFLITGHVFDFVENMHNIRRTGDPQFIQHIRLVLLHGAIADRHRIRDLLTGLPVCNQVKDLFSRRVRLS